MKPLDFLSCLFHFGALILLSLSAWAQSGDPQPEPAGSLSPAPPKAFLMRIEGPLDRSTQSHLKRSIDLAAERGSILVVELETPGGEVTLMWQMARALELAASERGVTTVAFVNENALSAGALIALACDRLYMHPNGSIGSSLVVRLGPLGIQPVDKDPSVVEKVLSKHRQEFRTIATNHGRPGALAEAMVDPSLEVVELLIDGFPSLRTSVEYDDLRRKGEQPEFLRTVVASGTLLNLNGNEAVKLGMADGTADSQDKLALLLGVQLSQIEEVERRRSEDAANFLYQWTPLFLILGFLLAYVELKVPGFGVAGVLSIVCFSVVLVGRYLVGMADVPHVILIVVGVGLLAAEVFLVPGTIWAGVLGAICVIGGLIWSFAGSSTGLAYGLDRQILLAESLRILGAACLAMLATWSLSRFLPSTPIFGRLVLDPARSDLLGGPAGAMPESRGAHAKLARPGARGRSLTALRPAGKVVLTEDESIEFEARSNGPAIEPNQRVVVVEALGSGRLLVEPEAESDPGTTSDVSANEV